MLRWCQPETGYFIAPAFQKPDLRCRGRDLLFAGAGAELSLFNNNNK